MPSAQRFGLGGGFGGWTGEGGSSLALAAPRATLVSIVRTISDSSLECQPMSSYAENDIPQPEVVNRLVSAGTNRPLWDRCLTGSDCAVLALIDCQDEGDDLRSLSTRRGFGASEPLKPPSTPTVA